MHLTNLDAETRRYMREEVEHDTVAGVLYPGLLLDAVDQGDPASLAADLSEAGRLDDTEIVVRKGTAYTKAVPVNAPETLAEGEFNRFYARALCRRALVAQVSHVRVYRAKPVAKPRSESVQMIGTLLEPQALLDDLRTHIGMDTALGLPPGPNSGLSIELAT